MATVLTLQQDTIDTVLTLEKDIIATVLTLEEDTISTVLKMEHDTIYTILTLENKPGHNSYCTHTRASFSFSVHMTATWSHIWKATKRPATNQDGNLVVFPLLSELGSYKKNQVSITIQHHT